MAQVFEGMRRSAGPLLEMGEVTCCYSRLSKSWVADPQGLFWETFVTRDNVTTYGEDPDAFDEMKERVAAANCCGARPTVEACCGSAA